MSSDELFSRPNDPNYQWEGLEKRVNRLLEGIVQLRNANAQLMKENVLLKNQMKDMTPQENGSSEELQKLRHQYEDALRDLRQVKNNLERIESLAKDLKLEV
ncbi:MAG TPA: hypothetical protein VMV05_05265 [bacterium]|nr:hypothetical protein [bacterium]